MRSFAASLLCLLILVVTLDAQSYEHFEASHTHSIALTPDGARLLAVNSPDARLSVFDATQATPVLLAEIAVGLEPVAVRARTNDEVWVVNEVSDSVSIISLSQAAVIDTILVGDEPSDVVFAQGKAFITCARQNSIRVLNAVTRASLGTIALNGLYPTSLAVSADGSKIYTVFLHSGNGTTVLKRSLAPAPPTPTNPALPAAPQTGLIVPTSDSRINYTVLDNDVAVIDATSHSVSYFDDLGTSLFDVVPRPGTDELWVPNTEALNLTRFEPALRGHFIDNRLSKLVLGSGAVTVLDLNAGLDYNTLPNVTAQETALSQPTGIVFSSDGSVAWTAAFGSDRVAKLDAVTGAVLARVDSRTSGSEVRGPRALVWDEAGARLFVLNKLSNTLSVIDSAAAVVSTELAIGTYDPTPAVIKEGRGYLFDARLSGNGTASCASCHLDADRDGMAWDLGDPGGDMLTVIGANLSAHDVTPRSRVMHPMKGPMTTQTLRGMQDGAPFHWRGDKPTLHSFNSTFDKLMGGSELPEDDINALHDYLLSLRHAANPNRNRDRTLPTSFASGNPVTGRDLFNNHLKSHCNVCHILPSGSDNNIDLPQEAGLTQPVKNPPLRTVYQRMFFNGQSGAVSRTGFGMLHDGTGFVLPTVHAYVLDQLSTQQEFNDLAAFMQCFDTGTAPTVGYSRTARESNKTDSAVLADIALLEARAVAGDCDLIVRGTMGGEPRSWQFVTTTQTYRADRSSGGSLTRSALLNALSADDAITFVGVLPGSGARMGGDRDEDGFLDADDPNPTTPNGPPVIVQDPVSGAVPPGGTYTFSVQADGIGLSYQWKKGTANVNGETSSTLTISNADAADAGSYTVVVTNVQGSRESEAATLGVYAAPAITVQPLSKTVNEGQSASFVVTATGSAVTYQWKRGSTFINGATSRTLSLTAVDINDIGSYSVVVANGAGSVTSNSVALAVNLKPVVNALNLPDVVVSQSFSHTVTAQYSPTTYTFSGLPPGLVGDRLTGAISGRATLAGLYTVTVKATNAAGTSPAGASDTMEVEPFPTDAIGTFHGALPRHVLLNANLGGKITLTSTLKGTFSGNLVLGTASHVFSGALDIAAGVPPEATVVIKRKGSSELVLNLEIDTALRTLSGTLSAGGDSLSFSAELPASPVGSLPGHYTLATKLATGDVGLVTVPQGHCIGGLKVDAKGVGSGTLRLSDDTVVTLSAPLGQQGGAVVFALLYGKSGSFVGSLDMESLSTSSVSWFKRPQTANTRSYKTGFGPLNLSVVGGRYAAPAAGALPLNATPGMINARMTFAEGGAPNPARRLNVSTIEIVSGSPAVAKFSKPNPGIVTLTLTPGSGTAFVPGSTGTMSGSFTLMDADPTVTPAKALLRTVTYRGALVNDDGVPRGLGFFLLPELPSVGPPKTTLATSRLLSGSVRLEALP